ncbi:MAG: toll/interleukin-1 receptor domain-containing protein [Anaerolineae bacterium]|nr:toll/interleukin-1 receptor domain-containing protein [Anaerolineae bacterium]
MPRVFISYRRADSITITGRIYDHLVRAFGDDHVFKDVDDIPVGVDFRRVLQNEVGGCDVLLVIIGPQWLRLTDEQGRRRIDDPHDFVRIEVAAGLARQNVLVVPVLVSGAAMPAPADLPPDLVNLAYRNAAIVRDDPDFSRDMRRLIEQIRTASATPARAPQRSAPAATAQTAPRVSTPRPEPAPRRGRSRWPLALAALVIVGVGGVLLAIILPDLNKAIQTLLAGGEAVPGRPLAETVDAAHILSCGTQASGSLDSNHWQEHWLFQGEAGQTVLIAMDQQSGAGGLDPALILRNESEEVLIQDDDSGDGTNARLVYVLPRDGMYLVTTTRAGLAEGNTSGLYALTVDCGVKPISCDRAIEGTFNRDSPEARFAFFATGGTRINAILRLAESKDAAPPDVTLELLSPADRVIAIGEPVDDFTQVLNAQPEDTGLYILSAALQSRITQQQQQYIILEGDFTLELQCD